MWLEHAIGQPSFLSSDEDRIDGIQFNELRYFEACEGVVVSWDTLQ